MVDQALGLGAASVEQPRRRAPLGEGKLELETVWRRRALSCSSHRRSRQEL